LPHAPPRFPIFTNFAAYCTRCAFVRVFISSAVVADGEDHRAGNPARTFHQSRGGRLLFENQQNDVEVLIKSDAEFRSLYQRHQELDSKVRDAELGVLPMDDTTLHNMKKEKLRAKDKLTVLWERYQAVH
jgi:uncharacterized protein YdcH (DUF465 family)